MRIPHSLSLSLAQAFGLSPNSCIIAKTHHEAVGQKNHVPIHFLGDRLSTWKATWDEKATWGKLALANRVKRLTPIRSVENTGRGSSFLTHNR